ncbi:hypothetical protein A7K94_0212365, partial [Modestobacter sp. VKM Ac-2676]
MPAGGRCHRAGRSGRCGRGGAGVRCAELAGALADRTAAVAAVLDAALTAYRAADAGLAGQLAALDPPGGPRVPR